MRFQKDGVYYDYTSPGWRYGPEHGDQHGQATMKDAGDPQEVSAFERQVGGTHYSDMAIQPVEFIHRNGIGFSEGTAIAYLARWRSKGGIDDLRKAIHTIEQLIELETNNGV